MSKIVIEVPNNLSADAKRSLTQRLNHWGAKYNKRRVSEAEPAVRVIRTSDEYAAMIEGSAVRKPAPAPEPEPEPAEDDELLAAIRAMKAELASIRKETATPTRTTTRTTTRKPARKPARKPVNTFYQDVIVGKYEQRVEARPYKCEEPRCYKYGHRFTKTGWFGDGTKNGHFYIAPAHR